MTGDPACKTCYKWKLSIPQVRWAFLHSQAIEQMGESETAADGEYAAMAGTDATRMLAKNSLEAEADATAPPPFDCAHPTADADEAS